MEHPTVLVTGASRGLGAEIARQLAYMRANLVLMARSQSQLAQVARECEASGVNAWAVSGDVTREADCERAVREALEQFGRLDGLVNNSGVIEPIGMMHEAPADLWRLNWEVNVLGPVMLIQKALPELRRQRGRIVNISSGAAESVIGGWAAYSSSKAAVNKITQVLASEEPEISVVALKPGVVDTDMQATIREKGKSRMAEQNYQRLAQMYESGTMNPPEKPALATAVLALAMPKEWSGEILRWDEERVRELVRRVREGEK